MNAYMQLYYYNKTRINQQKYRLHCIIGLCTRKEEIFIKRICFCVIEIVTSIVVLMKFTFPIRHSNRLSKILCLCFGILIIRLHLFDTLVELFVSHLKRVHSE